MNASSPLAPATSEAPALRAGTHLDPDSGACLMERVSVAAGVAWSDHPGCTHPLIAHLARRVNDAMSDTGRDQLLPLIPMLAHAAPPGLGSGATIAATCCRYTLEHRPTRVVRLLHAMAERQLGRRVGGRVERRVGGWVRRRGSGWVYEHGAAYRTVEFCVAALVALPRDQVDRALAGLLTEAVIALDSLPRASALLGSQTPSSTSSPESLQPLQPLEPLHPRCGRACVSAGAD